MPAPVEPKCTSLIESLVRRQRLDIPRLPAALAKVDRAMRAGRFVHPSFHADGTDTRTGEPVHLRVLIWRSEEWRRIRTECLSRHRRIAKLVPDDAAFTVPDVVRSGTSPLLWDLTAFTPAKNLPWQLAKNGRLDTHVAKVAAMFAIAEDFGATPLRGLPVKTYDGRLRDIQRRAEWSVQAGILDRDTAMRVRMAATSYAREWQRRDKLVVAHGDYGPNNVLFRRGSKPVLIDFDHLRRAPIGDMTGRLVSIGYSEKAWTDRVLRVAENAHDEPAFRGFIAMALWHTLNRWYLIFKLEAPAPGVRTVDELPARLAREINGERAFLKRLLDY